MLPWNERALRQDLGLDLVLMGMAGEDDFLRDVATVALLQSLTDVNTIRYRQHAYTDCFANAKIIREMYQIAIDAIEAERKNYWSFFARYPSGTLHRAVEVLQSFVGMLQRLRRLADLHAAEFQL